MDNEEKSVTSSNAFNAFMDTKKGQSILRGVEIGLVAISLALSAAALIVVLTTNNKSEPLTHTVTFRNFDNAFITSEAIKDGEVATDPEITPSKPSDSANTYSFSGWDKEFTIAITEDTTYTAQYAATLIPVVTPATTYDVRFINFDGSLVDIQSIKKGEKATIPTTSPVKPSDSSYVYTFSGWSPSVADTVISADTSFIAQFSSTPVADVYYTANFFNYDGSLLSSQSIKSGNKATAPGTNPTKTADSSYTYAFSGWAPVVADTIINSNTSFVAQYLSTPIVNPVYHTVRFIVDGTLYDTVKVLDGEAAEPFQTPTKGSPYYNYGFPGWYSDSALTQVAYTTQILADSTFYSTFEEYYKFKEISLGSDTCYAVSYDGSLWAWGSDKYGQIGDGDDKVDHFADSSNGDCVIERKRISVAGNPFFTSVKGSGYMALALSSDGGIYSWGLEENGCLGDGTDTTGHVTLNSKDCVTSPKRIEASLGSPTFTSIDTGNGSNSCFAIDSKGIIWSWGKGTSGILGSGDETDVDKPYQRPVTESGATVQFQSVSSGYESAYAIATDHSVWSWGSDTWGQLGNGTSLADNVLTPTKLSSFYLQTIDAGIYHVVAIDESGIVWTWGQNTSGQVGNDTMPSVPSPVNPTGLGSVTFISASAGPLTSFVISSDNQLYYWGNEVSGGGSVHSYQAIPSEENGKAVKLLTTSGGIGNDISLAEDGRMFIGGKNNFGQCGNGSTSTSGVQYFFAPQIEHI